MKAQWFAKVSYIYAQDAAFFFLFIVGVVIVSIWLQIRSER